MRFVVAVAFAVLTAVLWFNVGRTYEHMKAPDVGNIERKAIILGKMDAMSRLGIKVCDIFENAKKLQPKGWIEISGDGYYGYVATNCARPMFVVPPVE